MMTPLLSVRGASKSYGGIPALIDADLDVFSGEVHALMGENGAGKSTLIRILAGVIVPDHAAISINGQPAVIHSPQAAFGYGLRFIHQELHSVRQVSAAENIFLGQRYPTRLGIQVRWRVLFQQAEMVLAHLGITHIDPRRVMGSLSPGDQMLITIARAFVGDDLLNDAFVNDAMSAAPTGSAARIYVMDEPTAALTGAEAGQLFRVIERLCARGCGVLYVSHRIDEIFAVAARITVMRDGRVVDTTTVQQVTPADLIVKMTGRDVQQLYPPRTQPFTDAVLLDIRDIETERVRDVMFQVRAGEIVGLAGLNGAGRTEVLRALMGADRLKRGEIWLEGERIDPLSPSKAWEKGIAFVPEERRTQALVLPRSAADNITLPHLNRFSYGRAVLAHRRERQTSRAIGDRVRLKARSPAQVVRELSGGNQQKVVFGRALAAAPRMLLLDEPTRGVDVGAKADLYQLIHEISGRGVGIVLVSSDLAELIGLADRIVIMRGGAQIAQVDTPGLSQEYLLTLCYGNTADVGSSTRVV
ncbi:MAG: sugar ABC transporter ATP-binding protein [bacterium]|nr:sugar ABC transporter ATP-binding protein [bacterium]